MKTLIIHHSADSDGLMSEAVCRHFLADRDTELASLGWDYGQPVPELPPCDEIYMVDVSIDTLLADPVVRAKTVLIDHHRTCRDKWLPVAGFFKAFVVHEGVAACRLCWWWFDDPDAMVRSVAESALVPYPGEPPAVFLIGLRDVWRHQNTRYETEAKCFEMGLRSIWPPSMADLLGFTEASTGMRADILHRGEAVVEYADKRAIEEAQRGAHVIAWEGLRFLALNTQARGSMALDGWSQQIINQQPHDALLVWAHDGAGMCNFSLYHAAHHKDLDLSVVAKKHGGGGHPGACGFRLPLWRWINVLIPQENEAVVPDAG